MSVGQLSVFLENKKGRIAELVGVLAQEGIAVFGFSVAEVSDYGIVRILAEDGAAARHALEGRGFTVVENRVVSVRVPNGSKDLADVVAALSNSGESIEYLYLTTRGTAAIRVEDTDGVEALLRDRGFECLADVQH